MIKGWRLDILYNSKKQTYYFYNKTTAFEYLQSISDYLYAGLFKFDGKIWKQIKIFWN